MSATDDPYLITNKFQKRYNVSDEATDALLKLLKTNLEQELGQMKVLEEDVKEESESSSSCEIDDGYQMESDRQKV